MVAGAIGKRLMRRLHLGLAFLAFLGVASARAQDAANYPSKPVKIIVSVPAGGGVDTVTRIVADGLQKKFGQPFVIENRGGAAGNIGAEAVYTSEPDGYTLLASQAAPVTINGLLYSKLNFDPSKFEPVAIMSSIPNVLLVRASFPAKTVQDLLAYARANPGKMTYASQGIGTSSHLTTELFAEVTGVKLQHVPYRGTAPALNDIAGGQVDMFFVEIASAMELQRAGHARVLAVAGEERLAELPDVPTLSETGIKDVLSRSWNAITAPPNTPAPIIQKLNAAISEVLASEPVRARFHALLLHSEAGPPARAASFIAQETRRWAGVIRKAGVKPH
jgi:tripartite-type tricarboxylate transporter receptor subunit TctC